MGQLVKLQPIVNRPTVAFAVDSRTLGAQLFQFLRQEAQNIAGRRLTIQRQ